MPPTPRCPATPAPAAPIRTNLAALIPRRTLWKAVPSLAGLGDRLSGERAKPRLGVVIDLVAPEVPEWLAPIRPRASGERHARMVRASSQPRAQRGVRLISRSGGECGTLVATQSRGIASRWNSLRLTTEGKRPNGPLRTQSASSGSTSACPYRLSRVRRSPSSTVTCSATRTAKPSTTCATPMAWRQLLRGQ